MTADRPPAAAELVVDLALAGETVEAGRLEFALRGATATTVFAYSRDFLRRRRAYSVAPEWSLDTAPHLAHGLPAAFADTTPDWWGRTLITRRRRAEAAATGVPTAPVTELDFLLGVSDITRQGALRFRAPTDAVHLAADAEVPKLVDLTRLLAAVDTVVSDPRDDAATRTAVSVLLGVGTGTLGGARPKASVRDGDTLHVAKFPDLRHDTWDVMAWEKTALDLAERAGIPTPARRLLDLGGRHVLLVERFDRQGDDRIGYVSAGTFIGGERTAARDYLDLQAAIEDHSADPEADLLDLFHRIAFSLIVNNTDDHMRNTAFLRTAAGWRLSPVFDVNPDPETLRARASSVFGEVTRGPALDALRREAAYFGLAPATARDEVGRILDATADWRDVAAGNGIAEAEIEAFTPVFDGLRRATQ